MEAILYSVLLDIAISAAIENFKVEARKRIDDAGNAVIELYRWVTGADGTEAREVLASVEDYIPDIVDGLTLVVRDGELGYGLPVYEPVDGFDFGAISEYEDVTVTDDCIVLDYDYDGDNDYIVPFDYDLTSDGFDDYGIIVTDPDTGLPQGSDDAPFYPMGSDEFTTLTTARSGKEECIIVMSADGTMSIYNMNGELTAEQCDTAYSLWVSKNGIMNKPIENYSVTEGLLLIAGIVACFAFIGKLFRRRRVM